MDRVNKHTYAKLSTLFLPSTDYSNHDLAFDLHLLYGVMGPVDMNVNKRTL